MTVDIFAHEPALCLALALEEKGIHLAADGDELVLTPRRLLTRADLDQCRRYKAALLLIARICDPGVQYRCDQFVKQQPSTVCVLDPSWRFVRGICFSCGAPVPTRGRCWRCALAMRLALHLPITVEDPFYVQSSAASLSELGPGQSGPELEPKPELRSTQHGKGQ